MLRLHLATSQGYFVYETMPGLVALEDEASKKSLDRIVETLVFLYTESRRLTKEAARAHDLTGPQLTVIKLLSEIGDLSLTGLSRSIQANNSTVTGIIDRMEANGLVRRVRSDSDRRVVMIRLTPHGRALAQRVPIEPMQAFRRALETLAAREQRVLLRILARLEKQVRAELRGNESERRRTSSAANRTKEEQR